MILFIAAQFRGESPGQGTIADICAFMQACQDLGQAIDCVDPTPCSGTQATSLETRLLGKNAEFIVLAGPFPRSFNEQEVIGDFARRSSARIVGIDVQDEELRSCLELDLSTVVRKGSTFLAPWVDLAVFKQRGIEKAIDISSLGDISILGDICCQGTPDAALRRALEGLSDLNLQVQAAATSSESQLPQNARSRFFERSRVYLDVPIGDERARVAHILQASASGTLAVAVNSTTLEACLEPDLEFIAYHGATDVQDRLRALFADPALMSRVSESGRQRVLAEHSAQQRAKDFLALLQDFDEHLRIQVASEAKVCVYMPVWNGGTLLKETIDSLLMQSHKNLNILVADDGSTDGTAAYLQEKAAQDPRLILLFLEHRSEVHARNAALSQLPDDTRYLMNHDADDLDHPWKIATLVAALEDDPSLDFIGCQARYMLEDGSMAQELCSPCDPAQIQAEYHKTNHFVHSAVLYKREILGRLLGYRHEYRSIDDYDFFARALEAGYRGANLPEVLHYTRLREASVSKQNAKRQERLNVKLRRRLSVSRPWRLAALRAEPSALRLHLGCGERYLEGYINVDFGSDAHPVQTQHKRDLVEDLNWLLLPAGSCREIRLHHVFEHFPRTQALRLLMEWHLWLEEGGELLLETPDLEASLASLGPLVSPEERTRVLRHLFGTQEASWALHLDAYDEARFRHILPMLGFEVIEASHSEWNGIHNITVRARKTARSRTEQLEAVRSLLDEPMIDSSITEQRLREVWQRQFEGAELLESGA